MAGLLDPRLLLMFGANTILLHLVLMMNSALAGLSFYLFILGPMLVFPSLYQRLAGAVLCLFLTGLWIDVAMPSTFGLFSVSLPICGVLVYQFKIRFRAEHNYHPVILAHVGNLILLTLVVISEGRGLDFSLGFWNQLVVSAALSHGLIFLVGPWFFDLQRLLFELCGLDVEPEEFPNA